MARRTRTRVRRTVIAPKPAAKKKKNEITKMGQIIRGLGALGGSTVGNMFGYAGEGKVVGRDLGAAVSRWLGSGDYTVKQNSIVHGSPSIPMMHQTGQSIIVRHKEFLCDVVSGTGTPTAFAIGDRFFLNPGLSNSFPWLSTIASQFQEYTWRGMVYHYVPTSGASVASTNTALGTVMMHTDYRVTAPQPVNKIELLNEYFASDARPSDPFCHPIECDPKENPYNVQYVRSGAVPAGEDPKSYDLGVVNIATQGFPGELTTAGEVWVTYEVELRKPQITVGGGTATTLAYTAVDVNTTYSFGRNHVYEKNDLGLTIVGKVITFPRGLTGKYQLTINYYSSGTGTTTYSGAAFVNCAAFIPLGQTSYPASVPVSSKDLSGAQGNWILEYYINITDPSFPSTITVTHTTMTNISSVNLVVTRMSPS